MHGDLSETSLTDVCRRLAVGAASGELSVSGAEADGWVSFRHGVIVAAGSPTPPARLGDRLVGAGELSAADLDEVLQRQREARPPARLGALLVRADLVTEDHVRLVVQEQVLDALFELSRWRFGSYQFRAGEPVRLAEVPVALPVDDALLDVARRQREWAELSVAIPSLAAVPVLQGEPGTTSVGLTGDEFTVLANVDGRRSVQELAAALGYGEFELARIVHGLVLVGLAVIELPEDEVGAALDDALSYLDQLADSAVHPDPVVRADAEREAPRPVEPDPIERARRGPDDATGEPDDATGGLAEATGELVEAELPPREAGSILAALHELDGDSPASSVDRAVDPATSDADQPAADADQPAADADQPAADADQFFADRKPAAAPRDADDVAEFLRELSRLALDGEPSGDSESTPRAPARRPPAGRETPEPRGRRRGLFGRS